VEPESLKKLRALKEKISKEWQQEHTERLEQETKDPLVPLSLASDLATAQVPAMIKKGQKGVNTKAPTQADRLSLLTREKIQAMKQLDKYLQRELENELDKKAVEMSALRSHNRRLRETIALREESNTRRERELEGEIRSLKNVIDEDCVDSSKPAVMLNHLKSMNLKIQDGADELIKTIEERAEAERLALIRTYRVRTREVKEQLKAQEAANLEGASAWIRRYQILQKDQKAAEEGLNMLESRNAVLEEENKELRVMKLHQDEQRSALIEKIAVVKRENKRFRGHISRLQQQIESQGSELNAEANDSSVVTQQLTPVRLIQSRGERYQRALSSRKEKMQQRPWRIGTPAQKEKTNALAKINHMLNEMRASLKLVRRSHIDLLQERSELDMFMRQCIEDVRRDIHRFTIISNVSRGFRTDQIEEQTLLKEFGVNERKRLLDILSSKLRVLVTLHEKMFPGRTVSGDKEVERLLAQSDRDDDGRPAAEEKEPEDGPTRDVRDVPAKHPMDALWERWKHWTRSITPVE
jgi:hypothetical protein